MNWHLEEKGIDNLWPKGMINKEQSKVHLLSVLKRPWQTALVGKEGCLGIRHFWKFFAVEKYTSDQKPEIGSFRGLRLIVWNPLTKTKSEKGWVRNFLTLSSWQLQKGFAENDEEYLLRWSQHARRHLRKWKKDEEHFLREVDFFEFEKAYLVSGKLDLFLRTGFMRAVRFHAERHPENLSLFLVRDKKTKKDIAGLATVDYPDISQSHHLASFLCQEAQKTSVGYGLIDNWFLETQKKGIAWLDFGVVWQKGNPVSWKGYSNFKRQFGLHLVSYPRSYLKLTIR